MSEERRKCLDRDAGGDDLEEAAVCYLQMLLADHLPGCRSRPADAGHGQPGVTVSGSAIRAAGSSRTLATRVDWLLDNGLISSADNPLFILRT